MQQRPASARPVFEGRLFTIWQWQQKLFDDSFATFEQLSRPDTVLILPIFDGSIQLIEEEQPGTRPMMRTIGGRIEPDELPAEAAARELAEETGLTASTFEIWKAWQPINKIDWAVYLFVAKGLKKMGPQSLDQGERISFRQISIAEILSSDISTFIDDKELLYQLGLIKSYELEKQVFCSLVGVS